MPSFAFISAIFVNYTNPLERRGFHFVIPAQAPAPLVIWGCGINGELLPIDFSVPEKPAVRMTSAVLGPALDQSRTLKWVDGRLLVATRDLLFWNASAGAGERPTLEQNVSWAPASARAGGGTTDDGINGVVQVKSEAGETMLVCTAPPDPRLPGCAHPSAVLIFLARQNRRLQPLSLSNDSDPGT